MGYNTTFQGQFKLNKTLDSETYSFLKKLANTRRMKRKVNESIYGIEGEFYVDGRDHDENIIDGNEPPKTQPSLWLQWIPTEERNAIVWDGEEKFYCADKWIIYLIEKVLKPKGYVLNGIVNAFGEETNDIWHISIVNNHVSIGNGEIELATCSNCGFSYDVTEINMVDYDDDLCVSCEKQVKGIGQMTIKIFKDLYEFERAHYGIHETEHFTFGTAFVKAENLSVTIFPNAIIIRNLENAMKPDQKVKRHTIHFTNSHSLKSLQEGISQYLGFLRGGTFAHLICWGAADVLPDPPDLNIKNSHTEENALNVFSPFLTPKNINHKIAKAILTSQVTKGIVDMVLTEENTPYTSEDFCKGEKIDLSALAVGLVESPDEWFMHEDEETDETIKLYVSHLLDDRTLYIILHKNR
ncbi:hypothetical protein MOB49_21465 [Bacillus haynesii]|uniref:hypothetical protein n=1 Tax=Bacillus TaxID=1386 RepID=UPI002280A7DC|nr:MULTISPECIES: hypothetical protein [Bacillus]MCY7969604.1 hypothetical protein [Bacillus haynesii]MCY8102770.1 hypothetical protein [Bacillus haynesii]MCY8152144.1 hypothetical protein [Bacillus paralicheniformis]MCY8665217.1 hypothetical protein [Bacillus haynesii]MEC1343795.1 hypothetical protein [Bacillus haynesii]